MFQLIKNNTGLESIDSLLDSFFHDTFYNYHNSINNIDYHSYSDDTNYYIDLALPGLEKKDINLHIEDNYLFLNYESNNQKGSSFWQKSFKRKIKLPGNIKLNNIDAKLKNGILSIQIQKEIKKSSSKRIEIK